MERVSIFRIARIRIIASGVTITTVTGYVKKMIHTTGTAIWNLLPVPLAGALCLIMQNHLHQPFQKNLKPVFLKQIEPV
jgi:hypothetical protein